MSMTIQSICIFRMIIKSIGTAGCMLESLANTLATILATFPLPTK